MRQKRIPGKIFILIVFVISVLAGGYILYFANQVDDFSDYKMNVKPEAK